MVGVRLRQGIDLEKLVGEDSLLMVPCGAIGPIIARKVLVGNGQALVPKRYIRMAIDNMDGVNTLLNNFDLTLPQSLKPLLFALLRDFE